MLFNFLTLPRASVLIGVFLASTAFGGRPAVAIVPFANNTNDIELSVLSNGLADLVTTDLYSDSLQVVERQRIASILDELKLAKTGFIDQSKAAKLGKGVQATHLLMGTFLVVDDSIRLDVRVPST